MTKISFLSSLATLFGVGRLPKAPGTWGTLFAIPLALALMWGGPVFYLAATIGFLVLAVVACEAYEQATGAHDPSKVVIDEVVGYLIAVAWLPMTWQAFLAAFLLFRLFDVWKPFVIGLVDRKVKGGLGTVLDDVAAGLVANIILQMIYLRTDWLGVQWSGGLG